MLGGEVGLAVLLPASGLRLGVHGGAGWVPDFNIGGSNSDRVGWAAGVEVVVGTPHAFVADITAFTGPLVATDCDANTLTSLSPALAAGAAYEYLTSVGLYLRAGMAVAFLLDAPPECSHRARAGPMFDLAVGLEF